MSRPGFSLVEVMVALAFSASMLVMAAQLVHQVMTLSQQSNERANRQQSVVRLTRQFRSDVHHADRVRELSESEIELIGDREIYRFEVRQRGVEWVVSSDQGVVIRRDFFPLTENSLVQFAELKFAEANLPRRIAMSISERLPLKNIEPRLDRQIEAILGQAMPETIRRRSSIVAGESP